MLLLDLLDLSNSKLLFSMQSKCHYDGHLIYSKISDLTASHVMFHLQVIYMIPVSVESSNMGVMEATVPDPDPGHLHVPTTTSAMVTTYPAAQGQLGETVGAVKGTERHYVKTESLIDHKNTRGIQPELSVKHKSLSLAANIRK